MESTLIPLQSLPIAISTVLHSNWRGAVQYNGRFKTLLAAYFDRLYLDSQVLQWWICFDMVLQYCEPQFELQTKHISCNCESKRKFSCFTKAYFKTAKRCSNHYLIQCTLTSIKASWTWKVQRSWRQLSRTNWDLISSWWHWRNERWSWMNVNGACQKEYASTSRVNFQFESMVLLLF